MRISCQCESCNEEVFSFTTENIALAWTVEARTLLAHASRHTAKCKMIVGASADATQPEPNNALGPLQTARSSAGAPLNKKPLIVECLLCNERWTDSVPANLVGACVIAFHASHEGHRLAFEFEGLRVEGPEKR